MSKDALQDLKTLIALEQAAGVGLRSIHKLLSVVSHPADITSLSASELRQAGLRSNQIASVQSLTLDATETVLRWAESDNHYILSAGSPFYPPQLKEIPLPPVLLFVIGQPEALLSPQLAMVGSRSPSATGAENSFRFAEALAKQQITITSGLAQGIDGQAHHGAIAAGGYTIAVCGTGLNRVYPAAHRELAHQIAKKGALVSELLPDVSGNKATFVQRNRIIAGLSLGTLIVEAAERSGALITARDALESNREVFAIPGSIHNPLAKGCHGLIKEGAKLVDCYEDIVSEIAPAKLNRAFIEPFERPSLSEEDAMILAIIDYEPTSLDVICDRGQLTVPEATNKLLELELSGCIKNIAGGYIRL